MAAWRRNAVWNEERSDRFASIVETLRESLNNDMKSRPAVKTFMASSLNGPDIDLVAFALSLNLDKRARDDVLLSGQNTLVALFDRITASDPYDADVIHHVAQWMVNSLATIGVNLPMSAELFNDLESRLRYDEFAYGFLHAHYLVDRPRALVLASIGAIVANGHSNEGLLEALRTVADRLRRLPEGAHDVFSQEFVAEVEGRYGVSLPTR
jgi:hypothetical protein